MGRRDEGVEYVPEISRTPGIVTNRRNHRERRPAAHGPPTPHGRRRGRYKPCEAMRHGAPFSMVSTVRDDPGRCGYLRDVLYTLRVTKKILARLRTAKSISRDLGGRCTNRAREIARDRVGGSRSSQGQIRANNRVEYVPEISRTPGIVTNRRNHRERRPPAHSLPTACSLRWP